MGSVNGLFGFSAGQSIGRPTGSELYPHHQSIRVDGPEKEADSQKG
jgi:hypothetical protein